MSYDKLCRTTARHFQEKVDNVANHIKSQDPKRGTPRRRLIGYSAARQRLENKVERLKGLLKYFMETAVCVA